jgi:hypothetical protein
MFEESLFECPIMKCLIYLFLFVVAISISIWVIDTNESNHPRRFRPGEKAISDFTADTVLIQGSSRRLQDAEPTYKVLYKAKGGLLLSAELPGCDLQGL